MFPIPLTSDWSSSARLTPVRRRREARRIEGVLQGVRRDVSDRHGNSSDRGDDAQVTERSLVDKTQVRPGVGEREAGTYVAGKRPARITDQHLTAHAEVSKKGGPTSACDGPVGGIRCVAHRQPQVLAAAP